MERLGKEIPMKSFYARSLWAALGLIGLVQPLMAAEPFGTNSFGSASLLPMPSTQVFTPPNVRQTAYGSFQEEIPSPSDRAPAPPVPLPEGQSFGPPPAGLSDYESAMKQSWDGSAYTDGSCGDAMCLPGGRACPRYYVYGGGLVLGRANQCNTAISQQVGTYETVLTTGAANQDWAGGVEGRIGWIMPNCCNAIELTYWGIFPDNQMGSIHAPDYAGGIRPILGANLDQVYYDDGMVNQSVQSWMTTTTGIHYISRTFSYNNVEANFLGNTYAWGVVPYGAGCGNCNGCSPCGGCGTSCLQFGWLAGFRYFQFNEGFNLNTDYNDWMVGDAGDYDEMCYRVNTKNTLLGFQMGGQGSWYINNCLSLYGSGRAGVFNNHVTSSQALYGLNGDAVIATGTYAGQAYRYTASNDSLAAIGQIDLGLRYQHGCHWSFNGGYRVVGISGVATAPGQFADNFADPRYVRNVCASDSVILHGAYAGVQYAW
jgi:hypothetical protein